MRRVFVNTSLMTASLGLLSRVQGTPSLSPLIGGFGHPSAGDVRRRAGFTTSNVPDARGSRGARAGQPRPAGGFIIEERFGSSQLPSVPVIVATGHPRLCA
jgi:hypothetical protein